MSSEAVYALLARAIQGAAMFGAGMAVILRLSPDQQGYFFSFMSFGALMQSSDFGACYAMLHNANHLTAIGQDARLPGLLDRALQLNFISALVCAVAVGFGGVYIFGSHGTESGGLNASWFQPWIVLVCALFLTQLTAPGIAYIEGAVSAETAWRFRFHLELLTGPILISIMFLGFGLWGLPAFWVTRFLLSASWLAWKRPKQRKYVPFTLKDWSKEVWPFQWKIGLSVLSGFLIFQSITPIVLATQGPRVSGQFGFSLAAMNMLLMVTTAWPQSKASQYGFLISRANFGDLFTLFQRVTLWSTVLSAGFSLIVVATLWWLGIMGFSFVDRFADTLSTGLLLAGGVVHHFIYCVAVLLRAGRTEPLMWLSLVGGLLTLVTIRVAATFGGVHEIAMAFLVLSGIGLPVVAYIYRRQVAQWTQPLKRLTEIS